MLKKAKLRMALNAAPTVALPGEGLPQLKVA